MKTKRIMPTWKVVAFPGEPAMLGAPLPAWTKGEARAILKRVLQRRLPLGLRLELEPPTEWRFVRKDG